MTEHELNEIKAMMKGMEWQVNISGKDSRKIYRSAIAANITAFALYGVGKIAIKGFKQYMDDHAVTTN